MFDNLHQILANLYQDMMPLCSNMIGVAKGLADWVHYLRCIQGLAGIAVQSYRHISIARPLC